MGELALQGVSAAPGVTSGRAVVLDRSVASMPRGIAAPRRGAEVERARNALSAAATELEEIAKRLRGAGRNEEADIVETGCLMARDPGLIAAVEALVMEKGMPAPVAVGNAAEQLASDLERLPDPMLALRADDLRSVGRRAAAHARGAALHVGEGVVIARTLGPADVAEYAPRVKGIALAGGGVTAHAAIVARSLGLPMVVGLGAGLLEIADGEEVIVDGDRGVVVRGPDAERVALARADAEGRRVAREVAVARRLEPAQTRDGHRVRVLANASTVAELHEATAQGAEGVGLLRSELLFLEATAWPTFEQQVNFLEPVLRDLRGQTATVRLFDFGGDKTPPFLRGSTARGIDLLLDFPDRLREHVAAIVAAGRGSELRILVPMVTDVHQMEQVRGLLRGDLAQLGAMIETPEAAAAAPEISAVADFLSLGTNDLTQLVLGLDREQSKTAPVLDVRVLRLIAATTRAAREARIPVDVCGEAASDPQAMRVLVGLGVDELSVAAARVGLVRQWVREVSYASCRKDSVKLLDKAGHASRERV